MKSWYRIENRVGDRTSVYLYDEVGGFGVTAADFVNDLSGIDGDFDLHINSPGGAVFDGMAIYNAIRNHPGNVRVVIDGLAASAASFVAMAGDEVVAERNATLMIHDGIGIAVGNAKDMLELAGLLDKFSDNIAAIYADRAGGTPEDWRKLMRAETWYSAQEAKDAGLVDEVIGGKSTKKMPTNTWDLSLFQHAGRQDAALFPAAKAPDPPPEPATQPDPPDEAGFLMPALDLGAIRDSIESLDDIPLQPDLIKAAVFLAATDVPAPDPAPTPTPDPEPDLSINLPALRRLLREVTT